MGIKIPTLLTLKVKASVVGSMIDRFSIIQSVMCVISHMWTTTIWMVKRMKLLGQQTLLMNVLIARISSGYQVLPTNGEPIDYLGMLMSMACRPDVAHAHSRLCQHQANPTKAAMDSFDTAADIPLGQRTGAYLPSYTRRSRGREVHLS